MKVTPLASGSSGNAFLIEANGTSILLDAGLSGKAIRERIAETKSDPDRITAILVSHGHSDHVKGVGVLSRRFKVPVYMNERTWRSTCNALGELHELRTFKTGRIFDIDGFKIHPFSVPHDCADPVGFRISRGKASVGIATDLGAGTGLVERHLAGVHLAILESNHDPKMLRDGPYPWDLKQRVKGRLGHLSNGDSARLLQRIVSDELRAVILAHVSETNNLPELALETACEAVGEILGDACPIHCASQHTPGPCIEL